MVDRPRWLSLAAIGLVAMMALVACTPAAGPTTAPTASTAPTGGGPTDAPTDEPTDEPSEEPTEEPSATAGEPTESPTTAPAGLQYPPEGGVTCRTADGPGSFNGEEYNGNVELISAPNDTTVIFDLCGPDTAFLQKLAFTVFAINDSGWLETNVPSGAALTTMNGTGPFSLDEWRQGTEILYARNEAYHGDPATVATGVLQWSAEAAARLTALQAGTVHGMTLVGPDDFETVSGDSNLQLTLPEGGANLNTFYVGFNHDLEPWNDPLVRQALAVGINRERLIENYYPEGSEVATHFTPCAIQFGCEGDAWPAFDLAAAQDLMSQSTVPDGFDTVINYRNVFRGYLPQPPQVATDLQEQLAELGINATIEEQESATFIDNSNQGLLTGIFLLGWGADYPEVTNFLDYHFGQACTSAFGACVEEIYSHLNIGNSTVDEAARTQAYTDANNAIAEYVPMVPIAHGAFANAYRADLQGAQASPVSNEQLYRMTPAEGDQVVFMQNSEPGTVFCADETDGEALRACEQVMEGLYGYATNTSDVEPVLATGCEPNEDGSLWTCTLKEGVTFHDGATFEAQDVITSFASQWDAAHPLHVGNTSQFEYWGLWGGFLNPSQVPAPPPA
jgi:ABC-type transport system substrate-binding protein